MRITRWGEYGIHCLVHIARKERRGQQSVNAQEIAEGQEIAVSYAQQILQRLKHGQLIKSVRGPGGGYQLARTAEEISLKDILIAAEGDTFDVICETKPLSAARCNPHSSCALRTLWYELQTEVNSFFEKYRLVDIVDRFEAGDQPIQIGQTSTSSDLIQLSK